MPEVELKDLVEETYREWQALGEIAYGTENSEKGSLIFMRSLFVVRDILRGDTINDVSSVPLTTSLT
jgi:N-acetylneuraminate synthase